MTAELKAGDKCPETATGLVDLEKHLESVKWNLWHGNVPHALQRIDDLDGKRSAKHVPPADLT
ncbi:hypothetical protein AYM40_36320 (plasmid) [Paraburkholderia phytofirmans OLGA172]|uniref:Uncharacterized protein n=1 Tax=Paraburkholderia phytofirmans OLGA172 TaxID=1417228 RepID=A0A167WNF9_9BURK|nr:hypothetical protein AYM40_36320 [Paraburkholderia phytofirmans OLGA172]